MKLKQLKINKDGEVASMFVLSQYEYVFLVNFAVNKLLQEGVASIVPVTKEELEEFNKSTDPDNWSQEEIDELTDWMEEMDPEDMAQS